MLRSAEGADPGEEHDLAARDPELLETLDEALAVWANGLGLPELDAPLGTDSRALPRPDPATEAQLRALGYLE
jgi:hypothetical protein